MPDAEAMESSILAMFCDGTFSSRKEELVRFLRIGWETEARQMRM